MNRLLKTFLFRDLGTPLTTLAGAGIIIMASSRLSFGLTVSAALLWVYNTVAAAVFFAQPFYPKTGKKMTAILLSSFLGSAFLLILWLYSPLLAIETSYLIILIPCYCVGSPLFAQFSSIKQTDKQTGAQARQTGGADMKTALQKVLMQASREAGSLGILITAFALIREPLGFMSLSLPGGPQGIIELFPGFEGDAFLPIAAASGSAGAFLLLGYGAALFRGLKKPDS
ncbi:MAG: hypothetical protein LBG87_03465 [Spirochaetaceae bacterium]|nr:hypothetical protein [Spirochaetaceae bacterium]